jgi:DNA-directed RNA polymerase subunit RPC12/RpoP
MEIDRVIDCMECGGKAHLLTAIGPEQEPEPGDVVAYRCEDCMERWDVVVEEDQASES